MAREELPAHSDPTTRRFDREAAPMDYSKEAMRAEFGRRQLWIRDMLKTETHTGFAIYDAQLDTNTSILALDIGMTHQTKEDIPQLGARGTAGKLLISLTREEAGRIEDGMGQVTEWFESEKFRKNAPSLLFSKYGVRSMKRLEQAMRARVCEGIVDEKIRQATAVDVEWHGFGGSTIAIEQTARNTMTKWTDGDPNSHRIKAVLSIMGSEKTRVNDPMKGTFDYHLEKHGKRQVQHATRELMAFVTQRKQARPELEYQTVRHLMFNGHSMGGEIAFALALEEDTFLPQLTHAEYAVDPSLDVFYLLNTPVTVGAKYDRSAVPLLGGWAGLLLKIGAYSPAPYATMRLAQGAGIAKLVHDRFFKPNARHLYELAAHLEQMRLDPLYVAQCVKDLNRAPDMRKLVNGNRALLNKIISERRMAAVIAQSDIILNPEKQFEALFDLDIPVFSLPGEDHYLYEQHKKLITTLQTKNVDLYQSLITDWLVNSETPRLFGKPVPYLRELRRRLERSWKIESYQPILELLFSPYFNVIDPIHDSALRRARSKVRSLIGRFFAENGWSFMASAEAFPLVTVIDERYAGDEKGDLIRNSRVIKEAIQAFTRYTPLLCVVDQTPTVVSNTLLNTTALPTMPANGTNAQEAAKRDGMSMILERNLIYLMHDHNALSAMGMSKFAEGLLEGGLRLPRMPQRIDGSQTAVERLARHLDTMVHVRDLPPYDMLALYRTLANLLVDYVEEINGLGATPIQELAMK